MLLDEAQAKTVVRALLDAAEGEIAEFVLRTDVLARSGPGASIALDELVARRWVRVRGDRIAATTIALEFGMDWTNVPVLLRAVLNSAGGIGRDANPEVVVIASGLPKCEVSKLLNQLGSLGLAHRTSTHLENGSRDQGVYITGKGWEYLTTGIYKPLPDMSDQLSAFTPVPPAANSSAPDDTRSSAENGSHPDVAK